MSDPTAPLNELLRRIDLAIKRVTNGHAPMRVPVDLESDVDIVLSDCRTALTRAQQAQPVAGWEPTMAAICGRCGDNYGSHAGNDCPDRKGKFAPSLAQTRREVAEECAKACDKAATEIEAMAIYQHSEYLKGAAAESRSRAIALRALAPAIQQGKETKNG